MSDREVLRAWEEHVVVREKGSRVVHYMLKDNIGNSVLAVVGRERCKSHMVYTISEDFLCFFGSTSSVRAGKKWQARGEVVDWLVSVVSKGGPILANSISRKRKNAHAIALKVEHSAPGKPLLQASKRVKSCRSSEIVHSSCTVKTDIISDNHVVKWESTCDRVRIINMKRPIVISLPASKSPCKVFPKFNENIELLSQDSGMRGCWFNCKILLSSKTHLKVQYKDVLQADRTGKLEEWVPASRVAVPDKLGTRHVGRLTIRPLPRMDSSNTKFAVGAAVDVWWCNGWWEGVIIRYETPTNTNLQVYLPGESRFLTVARKNMRVSRDWIDNRWVNIRARRDILSFLSSIFSPHPKLTTQAVFAKDNGSAANSKSPSPQKCEKPEVDKWKIPSSNASISLKDSERPSLKKQLISRYNEELMQMDSFGRL